MITKKLFVKFVPYNTNTLCTLINKQVYFSKVYEFNDFNELNYIACPPRKPDDINIIYSYLTNYNFKNDLIKYCQLQGYTDAYMSEFVEFIKLHPPMEAIEDEEYRRIIYEWIAFFSVGIFSVSDISVFNNDSAMLMFAHYARNNSGLALIYSISESNVLKTILHNQTNTTSADPIKLSKYIYEDMNDFLIKSPSWGYEQEYRMFKKPGLIKCEEISVELKSILYTPRSAPEIIDTLNNINTKIYGDALKIQAIFPNFISRDPLFKTTENILKDLNVFDWINNHLPN